MANHEAARQYGQAILDAVSASDVDDDGEAMNLASQRALEVEAVTVTVDDDDVVTVDLSDAIGGTMILVRGLVTMVREATGEDDDVILAEVRERLDANCRP